MKRYIFTLSDGKTGIVWIENRKIAYANIITRKDKHTHWGSGYPADVLDVLCEKYEIEVSDFLRALENAKAKKRLQKRRKIEQSLQN